MKKNLLLSFLLLNIFNLAAQDEVPCTNFDINLFTLNGNASYLGANEIRLTPNSGEQVGTIWANDKLDLTSSFTINAEIYLGTDEAGADGAAFVLQPISATQGVLGGGLGYGGISPSLAFEFDTYDNGPGLDPTSSDHIALIKDGNAQSASAHSEFAPFVAVSNMENGAYHPIIISWDAATMTLSLTYDGTVVISTVIDIQNDIFGGTPFVYWGFTAATGALTNVQKVKIINYCAETECTSVFAAPTGQSTQYFCLSATLADLVVTGDNIKWYDSETSVVPLAANTPLVNGVGYFATRSILTCESSSRLEVTAVVINPTVNPVTDKVVCMDSGPSTFDLTTIDPEVLGSQSINDFGTAYFTSYQNAQDFLNPITSYTVTPGVHPIFVQVYYYALDCFVVSQFNIIGAIATTPVVSDVSACGNYTLPDLPAGSYYSTGPVGTGTVIPNGTVINTAQTIYVINETGTIPNCTAQASFAVTISPPPTAPVVPDVTICDAYTLPEPPAGCIYNTQSGGTGTTLAANTVIHTTQTIFVIKQTGPGCSSETSFTVTINHTPVADNPGNVGSCGPYVLPVLSVGNYFTQSGGQGTQLAAGTSIATTQTVYIYAETGTVPNCFTENSMLVSIVSPPVAIQPSPLSVCDPNNDHFACFDLSGAAAQAGGGDPDLLVSFYETASDAQNGFAGAALTPAQIASYCTVFPDTQTLYIRVSNVSAPACAAFTTLVLTVEPTPVPNPSIADYALCDYTNPGDGLEDFDLPSWDSHLTNNAAGVTVSYYLSQAEAEAGTGALSSPYNSGDVTLWARLENALGCYKVTSFNLVVEPLPVITPQAPYLECATGPDGSAQFDLISYNSAFAGGLPGVEVTYYASLSDAQGKTSPLVSPFQSTGQTIYVRAETIATGCYVTTSFDLTVGHGPVANPAPAPLQVCDPNNDCYATFDLSLATQDITGGAAGVEVTYYETAADAQNGWVGDQLSSPYANTFPCTQTIYVRVAYGDTGCASFTQLQLIVNPTPVASEDASLSQCDTNGDGTESFDLTQGIPDILNGMDPALYDVHFYPTQGDAQNDTAEILGTVGYASPSATIWVKVVNKATGCYDIAPLQLIVNALPAVPKPVPAYSLCDDASNDQTELFDLTSQLGAITGGQTGLIVTFYTTEADAVAGTAALSDAQAAAYPNSPAVQTLWIRVESAATGCFSITTMDLRVEPLPAPVLPLPDDPLLNICDGNQDGLGTFDLTALIADMQQGVPPAEMVITFYETQADAQNQVNGMDLAEAQAYHNSDPFTQDIWVGALNTLTGCYSVNVVTLHVSAAPVAPQDLDSLKECDTLGDTQDGVTLFDLTQADAAILAAQAAPGNFTVDYYLSQAAAEEGTSGIIPATAFPGSDGQQIWYRVENTDTDCFNISSFTLEVDLPLDIPISIGAWSQCDNDLPGTTLPTLSWDLTQITIPGAGPQDTVVFYPSQDDAQNGTNALTAQEAAAYVNVANPQTIGITITTPAGCQVLTTIKLTVLPLPSVQDISDKPLHECDDDANPGTEDFDLTLNQAYMANGDANLSFTYYLSQSAAENQVASQVIGTPTAYNSATGSVWVRVEKTTKADSDGNFCYLILEQALVVDPVPVLATPAPVLYGCEIDGNNSTEFNLSDANVLVLAPGQDATAFTYSYYVSQADAEVGSQSNDINNYNAYTSGPATIYVRIEVPQTQCYTIGVFTLVVQQGATAGDPGAIAAVCADGPDGTTHVFDLVALTQAAIVGAQDPVQFTVAWYENQDDALAHTNAIADPTAYETASTTVYAVVTNTASNKPCTSDPMPVVLTVEPLLPLTIAGPDTLCVDYVSSQATPITLSVSGIDDADLNNYTYDWLLDGTSTGDTTPTIQADLAGSYTVVATSNSLGCISTSAAHVVNEFSINPDVAYVVSGAFQDNQVITVNVQGTHTELVTYQLDNGPITPSNVFEDVSMGSHTVTIHTPCQDITIPVSMINYPHFFTPNQDGYNDTWNIVGLENDNSARIYIFDRYGKLLKQISPAGDGWDGTYNGSPLPSTDYWFTVFFSENGAKKEFKAHFSLKR